MMTKLILVTSLLAIPGVVLNVFVFQKIARSADSYSVHWESLHGLVPLLALVVSIVLCTRTVMGPWFRRVGSFSKLIWLCVFAGLLGAVSRYLCHIAVARIWFPEEIPADSSLLSQALHPASIPVIHASTNSFGPTMTESWWLGVLASFVGTSLATFFVLGLWASRARDESQPES